MQAGDEVTITAAVKDILGQIKGGTKDPDAVLTQIKTKLVERRKFNAELKAETDATGWPKNAARQAIVEELVAAKCGKPKNFFNARRGQRSKEQELKDLAAVQAAEAEKKAELKRKAQLQQHVDRAAIVTANLNLTEYSAQNLRLLGFDHAGKVKQPERDRDGRLLSGYAMVAAVYDSVTQRYFVGKSGQGHTNANGAVPVVIWNTICAQTIDVKDDAFGTNCAEVDCLVKAFVARGNAAATHLNELTFVAYKTGEKNLRGPCHTCRAWMVAYGAKYLLPQ